MNTENRTDSPMDDIIIKFLSNDISSKEYGQLLNWLADEKNKLYFDRFRTVWQASKRYSGHTLFNEISGWKKIKSAANIPEPNNFKGKPKTMFKIWMVAASFLILISSSSILTWHLASKQNIRRNNAGLSTVAAPLGAKCRIVLPDSTEVWLNAGSTITYQKDFNDSERRVTLSGEAYFDVATNKEKPFMVVTSEILVRAHGTKFNVKAYPEENEITTTLEEGLVDIQLINGKKLAENIVLVPNEKVVYHKNKGKITGETPKPMREKVQGETAQPGKSEWIEVNSEVNTDLYTSWKDERWIIEGETLVTFAKLLERRYNITIVFDDEELKDVKFTGIIENETVEQLMEALRLTSPLTFDINKDTINLSLDKHLQRQYKKLKIIN
jgi:transmembrane sensor